MLQTLDVLLDMTGNWGGGAVGGLDEICAVLAGVTVLTFVWQVVVCKQHQ